MGAGLFEPISASEQAAALVWAADLSISGAEQMRMCMGGVWKVGVWEITFYSVICPKLFGIVSFWEGYRQI